MCIILCVETLIKQFNYIILCYFIYSFIHLFYSYMYFVECMYRTNRRPYEALTGKPYTSLLTYTTEDVQGRKLGHGQRQGSAYDDVRSGIRWQMFRWYPLGQPRAVLKLQVEAMNDSANHTYVITGIREFSTQCDWYSFYARTIVQRVMNDSA